MDPETEALRRLLARAKALLRSAERVNEAAWAVLNNPQVDAIKQLRLALVQHDTVVLEDATRDSLFPFE